MVDLVNDLNTEMQTIVENQEKKVLKLGNKFYNQFQNTFETLQGLKVKANKIVDNSSMSIEQKHRELTKLKKSLINTKVF